MNKFYTAILAFSISGFTAQAQSPDTHCGTMDHLKLMAAQNPQYSKVIESNEAIMDSWISAHQNERMASSTIVVPVVVHVIYNIAYENISDAQIFSQIDTLNVDYMRLNADTVNTPSAFKSVAGNPNIQFCLAQRDPQGFLTSGIVRVSTTHKSFNIDDSVKYTKLGGDDAWPEADYLNIWVCNLSGGVLGYAQFPNGGPAATDGVVITYVGFGSLGTAQSPYNKGRTATHEIGHWFNLIHTWGDDGGACTGTDYCQDTPNQGNYDYGCPTFPKVDNCTTTSPGIMFENYMDYTDDACMNLFTKDQVARMSAAINSFRSSIITSKGCAPGKNAGIQQYTFDASLSVFPNPTNGAFTIKTTQTGYKNITIQVYNVLGQLVLSSDMNTDGNQFETTVDLSSKPIGTYFVKITSGSYSTVKKILLEK